MVGSLNHVTEKLVALAPRPCTHAQWLGGGHTRPILVRRAELHVALESITNVDVRVADLEEQLKAVEGSKPA